MQMVNLSVAKTAWKTTSRAITQPVVHRLMALTKNPSSHLFKERDYRDKVSKETS